MASRTLLLPVDVVNRELDAKLLLALHAVARGWDVVVGQHDVLNANLGRFPRAVYFAKAFRVGLRPLFRTVSDLGHTIVGMDEEGLVNVSDDMWLVRSDTDALGLAAAVFAWGAEDARLYRSAKGIGATPVIETGNPRVDMLRPELRAFFAPEVERLRARYGRFALLNTNFSLVNHDLEGGGLARFRVADWVAEETAETMKSAWFGHKARLFDAFLKLLPGLAEALKPDVLIVRPHPSENAAVWREAAEGLDNVHVVYEGNVANWLAAADVLIHNGCTTAVEATVLGTPALSYQPVREPGFDNDLPNGLSRAHEDADGLIADAAGSLRARRDGPDRLDPDRRRLLEHHLSALDGPLACSRLLDEIERCLETPEPLRPARYASARARLAGQRIRRLKRTVRAWTRGANRKAAHIEYRFPRIPAAELDARIARLDAALGGLARCETMEIAPKLFRISRKPA